MNAPTPNLPLLRKILEHIDTHPEEWDQSTFNPCGSVCNTAMCVGGWACVMSGMSADDASMWDARWYLGLTAPEAEDLFFNTLDGRHMQTIPDCRDATVRERVQLVAEAIAARAGERL